MLKLRMWSMTMNNPEDNWYLKNNLVPPTRISHDVTDEQLTSRMEKLKPHSWRLEGNRLISKTDRGELVNIINPGYILTGIDKQGLPILVRINEEN